MSVRPEDRPVTSLFAEVVGQRRAVEALRAAGRHPVHAYLFRGPPGSGAEPAARGFAAALLCPNGGCGECDTCRRALAGVHPDLVSVERTGASLGVEEARRLVALAHRRPYEADRQVIVVHDVHLAVRSAPALLKTVEEPPGATVFLLLADDLPPELATVADRCVEVAFPPLAPGVVERWLVGRGVSEERARLVAEGAAGDLGRARLLAEDDGYAARLALWQSVPGRLDGTGATAGALARELLEAVDAALGPLRAAHATELSAATEEAASLGERGLPGRRELVDRQHREERRWRADELRAGLGVLARAYRSRLVAALGTGSAGSAPGAGRAGDARACEAAVGLITASAAALLRNPNETLLLEGLMVGLGDVGA